MSAAALAVAGGHASAQGSCLGAGVTILGTTGDDVLVGTDGDDVISAIGGNDVVDGGAGNDRICLGTGSDGAQGGAGDDALEGATEDDTLAGDFLNAAQTGSGDDDVAGGEGQDIVVGDVANAMGTASGEGDDKTNGGAGNDIVVGDSFSNSLSAGTGDDDLDLGPGSDLAVGDALTGTPVARAEPPSGAAAEAGVTNPMALGTGGDVVNGQTETDLIVGDAAIFGPEPGAQRGGAVDALAECSKLAARRIAVLRGIFGLSDEEILDFIPDDIKAEFQFDMLIGDCLGVRAMASGATNDNLNAGTENDLSIGDGLSTVGTSGRQAGVETHLGGKGNDVMLGDNADARVVGSSPSELDLEILRIGEDDATADIFAAGSPRGATIIGDIFQDSPFLEVGFAGAPFRSAPRERRGAGGGASGGDDHVRGGQGKDFLEGGPKEDKCSGGPRKDTFVEKGPSRCEDITGAP